MTNHRLILASGSPRRLQLLELIGLKFDVVPAGIDEAPYPGETPPELACRAAREKALAVGKRFPGRTVLGADTVVEIESQILGKPNSSEDAAAMLVQLSGNPHLVHTAIALVVGGRCHHLIDTAQVRFVRLTNETINWYVATGEAMDKAGAYAIQGIGGLLVAGVEGSPHTVVGLPLHRLPELFTMHDIDFWDLIGIRSN